MDDSQVLGLSNWINLATTFSDGKTKGGKTLFQWGK